jgi:hypothetical protein
MSEDQYRDDRSEAAAGVQKDTAGLVLCYLICPQDAAKNFVGAVLVTDSRTRPLHFAYALPVRPTKLQRLLYGSTLEEHVKIDVIAEKLLKNLPQVPDVIFVDSEDLLKLRRISRMPVAFLSKDNAAESDARRLSPLVFKSGSIPQDNEAVGQIVARLETEVDIVQPFERVREAMKEALRETGKDGVGGE